MSQQTAVDLPDPIGSDGGGDNGGFANADDLLAQLAGEEVDRLLNEADEGAPEPLNIDLQAVSAPATSAAAYPAPVAPDAPVGKAAAPATAPADPNQAALDDLFNELNKAEIPGAPKAPVAAAPAAGAASAAAPAAAASDPDQAALDDLFNELNKAEIAGAPAAAVSTAPVAPTPAPAPVSQAIAAPVAAAPADAAVADEKPIEQTIAERGEDLAAQALRENPDAVPVAEPSAADALAAEMAEDEAAHAAAMDRLEQVSAEEVDHDAVAAAAVAQAAALAGVEIDEDALGIELDAEAEADAGAHVPLLVRVLEWVNSPLAGFPDRVREALGKVALVTTVNAVAVLTYVLLFRRH
jgi:hypothetical protein